MTSTTHQRKLLLGIFTKVIWQTEQGFRTGEDQDAIFDWCLYHITHRTQVGREKQQQTILRMGELKLLEVQKLGAPLIKRCHRFRVRLAPSLATQWAEQKKGLVDLIKARSKLVDIVLKGYIKEYNPNERIETFS